MNKRRPLKLSLNTEEDKNKIMDNLRNLKDNESYYGLSVTHDYTMAERQLIKEKANEAKAKNSKEPENSIYCWRIRGTPKNGLILKRLLKKKPVVQTIKTN